MSEITARLRFHKDALARTIAFTLAAATVCGALAAGSILRGAARTRADPTSDAAATDQKDQSRLVTSQSAPDVPVSGSADEHRPSSVSPSTSPGEWRKEEFTFVEVVDGRTFRSGSLTMRLEGLELPDPDQVCRTLDNRLERCAARAATQLELLTRSRAVACRYRMVTTSEALGTCSVGASDLAARMVRTGYAQRAAEGGEMTAQTAPRG